MMGPSDFTYLSAIVTTSAESWPRFFGRQFTAEAFTDVLKVHDIAVSMDGKGRWVDNVFVERLWRSVKYEEIVCYERNRRKSGRKRCFTRDEGRPEVGLQEQASNRL